MPKKPGFLKMVDSSYFSLFAIAAPNHLCTKSTTPVQVINPKTAFRNQMPQAVCGAIMAGIPMTISKN